MSDVKASLLSCLTNLFPSDAIVTAEPADNKRDDDRYSVADTERHLFGREESFYWTWQYPSQW
jgi:hypothetical protein